MTTLEAARQGIITDLMRQLPGPGRADDAHEIARNSGVLRLESAVPIGAF